MPGSDPLEPVAGALTATVRWFQARKILAMVTGGVAVSLLIEPRTTQDVDAVIWVDDEEWPELLRSAREFDLEPFFDDPLGMARQNRILVLRHRPTNTKVDIACACLPYEHEVILRAVQREYRGLHVPIPRPDDLLVTKAVASRDKDLTDIAQLAGMLSKQCKSSALKCPNARRRQGCRRSLFHSGRQKALFHVPEAAARNR